MYVQVGILDASSSTSVCLIVVKQTGKKLHRTGGGGNAAKACLTALGEGSENSWMNRFVLLWPQNRMKQT